MANMAAELVCGVREDRYLRASLRGHGPFPPARCYLSVDPLNGAAAVSGEAEVQRV